MSVAVVDLSVEPGGVGRDLTWADLPVGGWIGDELAALPVEEVSTGELLTVARVWEKIAAWAAGYQAKALAEFAVRRDAEIQAELDAEEVFGALRVQALEADRPADEMSLALSVAPRDRARPDGIRPRPDRATSGHSRCHVLR